MILPMKITSPAVSQISCEGLRILVVDNDEIACEYLAQTLSEMGAETVCSDSGDDALEKLKQAYTSDCGFDIVLLDWKMPGMDGMQTAQAIHEHTDLQIPVIIASAYDWGDIEKEARKYGVDGFMQKPLFKSTLCNEIQRCIQGEKPKDRGEKLYPLKDKKILLVEDNQLNQEIAVELLGTMGAETETADDGVLAVAMFNHSPENYYDLILMDVQMPNMNGYDATRKIRGLNRQDAAGIPIVAMTADAFAEDVEMAKAAGMTSHLAKPFDIDTLSKEVLKVLH